ncbi:MAG: tetratricopeptide repeat protein, partial [Candidatus Obscuribacterales bacterium]|nr:tetratricopeptide repeat protein [Candidatus Obscuribacterales bacterium]
HAKSGHWVKAQDCFREACSKEPANVVALHDLATTYAHTSKLNDAAECEKKALAIDEKYVPAHVELAYVLRRLNDKEGAREHLLRALELDPDNQLARKNLEAISLPHLRKQKEQSSDEVPQQIAVVEPAKVAEVGDSNVSKALISRGSNMYRQGKYDVAKRFFQQALETCPESVSARSCLGVVLGSNGDIEGQIK